MIPSAQISFFVEYPLFCKHYGLMYKGVPTKEFLRKASGELAATLANPKSPILQTPSLMNILAGFKSRCNIFYFNNS